MEDAEYRKLAAVEDRMWYFRALHALIEGELADAIGQGSVSILDAGCGTGGLIRRLAGRHPNWRWTGVDFSPVACAFAGERTAAEIQEASVTALPFGDGTFDAVVLADVLYHVDDDTAALRESFRVLRPGGRIVLNVPAYRWLWSYHDTAVDSRRRYARDEVLVKLRAAGFGAARATHWNTLLFPAAVIRRKLLPAPRSGCDVELSSAPVEALCRAAAALERAWLGAGGSLPFGLSILAAGEKIGPHRQGLGGWSPTFGL